MQSPTRKQTCVSGHTHQLLQGNFLVLLMLTFPLWSRNDTRMLGISAGSLWCSEPSACQGQGLHAGVREGTGGRNSREEREKEKERKKE